MVSTPYSPQPSWTSPIFGGNPPADVGEDDEVPREQQFKGHRQPPISQRLEEAFNFLADEDPNRCLGFRDKLAEIDKYLAYIEKENFQLQEKDETLFRNVKVMAETHHDWDARVQKGWIDSSCGTRPLIQPISNRLLTGSQVEELQREREAMGVEEQMRGEDPPFSVERSGDYIGFIKALGTDSHQDPELVDDVTNLLFVESRAYDWAVREPAWIPYWMHPTEGLPTAPIKPEDDEPWYQKGPPEQKGRTLGRPPQQTLPELLKKREFEMNFLLAKGKNRTNAEEERLRILVFDHFPAVARMAWFSVEHWRKTKFEAQNKIDQEIKRIAELKDGKDRSPYIANQLAEVEDANAGVEEKIEYFELYRNIWYNWVQKSGGFQCVVESDNLQNQEAYPEILGVLIYPDENCVHPKLTKLIARANEIFALAEKEPAFWDHHITKSDKEALAELLRISTNNEWSYWVDPVAYYKRMKRKLTEEEEKKRKRLLEEIAVIVKERFKAVELIPPGGEPGNRRDTLYVHFQESKKSYVARETKKAEREEMAKRDLKVAEKPAAKPTRTRVDYTPQAERRGIQRAAIELGLNLLCGNHEQHRAEDKFRIVQLPGPYVDWSEIPEVPLTLPLDPTHRPVELEPFYFTEKVAKYRQQQDLEWFAARKQAIDERRGLLDPPANFKGPYSAASWEQYLDTIQKALKVYERAYEKMRHANETAPRPLMGRMLEAVTQAIQWEGDPETLPLNVTDEPFFGVDDVEMPNSHLKLLQEIAGDSWVEDEKAWEGVNVTAQGYNMAKLTEFCHDVEDLRGKILMWEPEVDPRKEEDIKAFVPPRHDPYVRGKRGISLMDILQEINNSRVEAAGGGEVHLWTVDEAKKYFDAMRLKEIIHYYDATVGEEQISLVPLTGHPENKYVVSLKTINKAPGVYVNSRCHHEVRYDSQGTIGPCIIQPNKIEHLMQLSWHLGRCIKRLLWTLATYSGEFERELAEVIDGSNATEYDFMQNLKDKDLLSYHQEWYGPEEEFITSESLIEIALELHRIAPDIAERASIHFEDDNPENMTERQAAILLQIQLLEENNNNWESRFPENEHVWDFAAPRLIPDDRTLEVGGEKVRVTIGPRRYFNMRRYPVDCQTEATQLAIKSSGPTVAEKSDAKKAIKSKQEEPEQRPGEIYRGWNEPPNFPLGETPYQQAFLSWRMDKELADVPEFKTMSPHKTPGAPPVYLLPPLPGLPSNFAPKSITPYENHMREQKELMKLPDAPDPDILENYFSQKEIADIKRTEAYHQRRAKALIATMNNNKELEDMTKEEIEKIGDELGMDPRDIKLPSPVRSPKRQAETQPTGQTSPKKPKQAPVEEVVTDDDHTGRSIAEETGDILMPFEAEETENEATRDEVVTGEGTGEEQTGEEQTGEEFGEEEEAEEETETGEETGRMVEDSEMYDS